MILAIRPLKTRRRIICPVLLIADVILHRYIRAAIAVKNSDGTCTLWNLVTFQQDYASNAFQKTKFDGVGDPVKIPCENVDKSQ